jgi:hypothetical protein
VIVSTDHWSSRVRERQSKVSKLEPWCGALWLLLCHPAGCRASGPTGGASNLISPSVSVGVCSLHKLQLNLLEPPTSTLLAVSCSCCPGVSHCLSLPTVWKQHHRYLTGCCGESVCQHTGSAWQSSTLSVLIQRLSTLSGEHCQIGLTWPSLLPTVLSINSCCVKVETTLLSSGSSEGLQGTAADTQALWGQSRSGSPGLLIWTMELLQLWMSTGLKHIKDVDILAKRGILACEKTGLLLRQRLPSHQCKATSRCYSQYSLRSLLLTDPLYNVPSFSLLQPVTSTLSHFNRIKHQLREALQQNQHLYWGSV